MSRNLFCLFLCLALPVTANAQKLTLITDQNRNYDRVMHGGWGQHLRSVMKSSNGSLWFTYDRGRDVNHNDSIRYRSWDGRAWSERGFNDLTALGGRVQQNTAHIMSRRIIYSYGVDIDRHRIVECYFDTNNTANKGCRDVHLARQPLSTLPASNYIGAAISPGGTRLIWWTTVGMPGKLFHTWNSGKGWASPVVSSTVVSGNTYNDAAYIRGVFRSDRKFEMLGQLQIGTLHVASHISMYIGGRRTPAKCSWIGAQVKGMFPEDIWADRKGGLHAIATFTAKTGQSPNQNGAYYYKRGSRAWSLIKILPKLTEARFQYDESKKVLYILANGSEGLVLRSMRVVNHRGAFEFDRMDSKHIASPAGSDLTIPAAIYNMSRTYQTERVTGLHFAIVGTYMKYDNQIFHLTEDLPPRRARQ